MDLLNWAGVEPIGFQPVSMSECETTQKERKGIKILIFKGKEKKSEKKQNLLLC